MAWHGMGWTAAWFSEIEPFPCKLLKHYYPDIPNLGNMLHLYKNPVYQNGNIDLLVGGTPCQSFSVAGLRRGLSDDRGNLALEYCRILSEKRPRWFVWENVPGVLSSYSGGQAETPDWETSDFAAILAAFQQCGYCCAWRVLDAQFTGVPQRRRRVFVVGYLGNDWRPPATVLFERKSLSGNFKTGRKTGQENTGTLVARTKGGGFPGSNGAMSGHVIAFDTNQITSPTNRSNPQTGGPCHTISKDSHPPAVAFNYKQTAGGSMNPGPISPTLDKSKIPAVYNGLVVRRLTPLECERLQGFPDHYTKIPGASDTVRYQAIGNSMAVPVMRWIGERINAVDKTLQNKL